MATLTVIYSNYSMGKGHVLLFLTSDINKNDVAYGGELCIIIHITQSHNISKYVTEVG